MGRPTSNILRSKHLVLALAHLHPERLSARLPGYQDIKHTRVVQTNHKHLRLQCADQASRILLVGRILIVRLRCNCIP